MFNTYKTYNHLQKRAVKAIRLKGYNWDVEFKEKGIRFGYWKQIPDDIFHATNAIIPIVEESDYDEETGWHYFYAFVNPEEQRLLSFNTAVAELEEA